MRGINRIVISGNVGNMIKFRDTSKGVPSCTFQLASDRHARGDILTTWVKINVYGRELVRSCRNRLSKGVYVIVEGELMNRDRADQKELVEVRAREVIFTYSSGRGGKPSDV